MKKHYNLLLLLSIPSFFLQGQNLVPNGDFESSTCPTSANYAVTRATGWQNMTSHDGTADYFHSCGAALHDWTNFAGNANAHGGNGYVGMGSSDPTFNGVEIATRALSTTLTAGETYTVSAWVFQAQKDFSSTAWCKNFGIKFNAGNPIANSGNSSPCPMGCNGPYTGGMIAVKASSNTVARNAWQQITTSYVANGTETHIILGTFNLAAASSVISNGTSTMGGLSGYIYFDDVEVVLASVLPVTLTSFNVTCNENTINADWTTSSEINNDFFVLEKSNDAISFSEVLTIKGSGNSNTIKHYNVTEDNSNQSTTYYRLKQVDFNGTTTYHDIIPINCKMKNEINTYPNPFSNVLNFSFQEVLTEPASIHIYNYLGEVIVTKKIPKSISNYTLNIEPNIASGIYHIKITSPNRILFSEKLIKTH